MTKKIIPTFDEMPTVSGTYGQPLSLMTVSQITGTNSVSGTWSITEENANAIYPTVGSGVAYEITFTPTDTDTYETITKSVVPTVTPKTVTVTAGNAEKNYGEEDPVFTYTVADNGLVGNDTLTGTLSRETGENVGTYTVQQGTLTNESNPNYDIRFEGGTFTIRALDLSGGTATQDNTLKYDGTAQKPTFTVTLQGNSLTEADYEITVTEQRNVGSYTATITGKGNYSGTITNVAWTIGKSDPTADMFRVVLPENLGYDGSEKADTAALTAAVEAGKPEAVALWNDAMRQLCYALAPVVAALNPQKIIFSGEIFAPARFIHTAMGHFQKLCPVGACNDLSLAVHPHDEYNDAVGAACLSMYQTYGVWGASKIAALRDEMQL